MSQQQNPLGSGRVALLSGGLAVLLVGLFAAAGMLVDRVNPADETLSVPSVPSATTPTAPAVTPSRNPRRQPDVDRGTPVDHGVYVEIAKGWTTQSSYNYYLDLLSWDRGAAAAFYVQTRPMPSMPLLRSDAESFADSQQIHGYEAGRPRALPVPNRNIVEAASISFTGRRRMDDATYSLSGECVRLRGAPDTNDVSVSICWAGNVQDLGTVGPEVRKMIASAARSI